MLLFFIKFLNEQNAKQITLQCLSFFGGQITFFLLTNNKLSLAKIFIGILLRNIIVLRMILFFLFQFNSIRFVFILFVPFAPVKLDWIAREVNTNWKLNGRDINKMCFYPSQKKLTLAAAYELFVVVLCSACFSVVVYLFFSSSFEKFSVVCSVWPHWESSSLKAQTVSISKIRQMI